MAEDTKTEDATPDAPAERTVPYSRFKEINDRLAAEKQRSAEYEERLAALEDRDKTDVERLTKEREKLEKRAADAEARAQELEAKAVRDGKASLVSNAAARLNFHDPALSSQLLNLEDIEDAKSAEAAVKALAKERPYLVRQDAPESARLKRIGVDGETVPDKKGGESLVTVPEAERMWGQQIYDVLTGPNTGAGTMPSE